MSRLGQQGARGTRRNFQLTGNAAVKTPMARKRYVPSVVDHKTVDRELMRYLRSQANGDMSRVEFYSPTEAILFNSYAERIRNAR